MSRLIPFGKYKGEPVERLAQDVDYLHWLRQQPWFKERFAWIEQAIIIVSHGSQEPEETPEHNRLQAHFLDRRFCWSLLSLRCPMIFRFQDEVAKARALLLKNVETAIDNTREQVRQARRDLKVMKKETTSDYWQRELARKEEMLSLLSSFRVGEGLVPLKAAMMARQFEEGGRDVTLQLPNYCVRVEDGIRCEGYSSWIVEPAYVELPKNNWTGVECKPQLGDDYPAVLRQMNANRSNTLLVDSFQSQAIDLPSLRKLFADSGKTVLTLADVEASLESLPLWFQGDDDA